MRNTEINHILHAAQTTPWSILPEKLSEIMSFLYLRTQGVEISADEKAELIKKTEDRQRSSRVGAVAVINIFGTISQRLSGMQAMSGGVSTEALAKEIRAAVADPDIAAIVLQADSPGGTVSGLTELHTEILKAREIKPIVASVNSMAASACYWIISAASEITASPSSEAGSIGVYAAHFDESAALEKLGVKVSLIHFGDRKVDGNPFQPLSEEARASIQSDVDTFGQMFHRDVAKGRGITVADVREKFGEGRLLQAKDAKAQGMVDRIETFEATITRLSRGGTKGGRKAEDLRRHVDLAHKFTS